ncbi:hypothetical protein BgiMline_024471 [Biomphalaria glabrata]
MDVKRISTVKIIGSKGTRQVGRVTSAERGLWPVDADIFTDRDFAPSSLTDEPLPISAEIISQPYEPPCELIGKYSEGPSVSSSQTILNEIIGPVRAATPRVRKRAAEKATLLTVSPFKKRLEEKKISVRRVSNKVGGAASQTTKKKGKER